MVFVFRSGEVRQLRLDDLDWEGELIRLRRPKQRRTQVFPLSRAVGDAILRYLKEVRPRTSYREVFLACNAPLRPLRDAALREAVALRLRSLGVSLRHYGPHALRHACATHLLEQGHSMKEIGDYLGHSCPELTYVYAKVNLAGLHCGRLQLGEGCYETYRSGRSVCNLSQGVLSYYGKNAFCVPSAAG
jgi:integrase